ncbi:MAG: TatD family hydrolase [Clostridia bacterium]|nr:TatD family hydrolase [Clostridia bacterium]
MLFDSHAHLNNADMTREDRLQMVAQIEATRSAPSEEGPSCQESADRSQPVAGAATESADQPTARLDYVMDIGFDPDSSALAVRHAQTYEWCYAVVGCHPHDAKLMDEEQLERIRQLAGQPKVCAVGEIGLDFHYDLSERDVQREWFRRQIRLANELRMPICIHAREADQEVMDILVEEGAFSEERLSWFPKRPDPTGFCKGRSAGWWEIPEATADQSASAANQSNVPADQSASAARSSAANAPAGVTGDARVLLHCFSGSAELGKQYVRMGATLSVAGPVTYKNNKKTVAMVDAIPIDFLLVETDSPYLSPVPKRGKPNTPPNVEFTARKVAEIKGIPFEAAAAKTKENAMRFYGIVVREL